MESSSRPEREGGGGSLQQVIEFSARYSPHYRALFDRQTLPRATSSRQELRRLPVLSRSEVQTEAERIKATQLPSGQTPGPDTQTSGSTGQPVKVAHTRESLLMFGLLAQRQTRWWRWEPMARYAHIRPPQEMPQADGRYIGKRETVDKDFWPSIGFYFETGPYFGYAHHNSLEDQLAWLDQIQPQYLLSQSANLEYLALGCHGRRAPQSLRACVAISQQLTAAMRQVVERDLGVPVFQNYGLNEIGMVAGWCAEGGRFHVHWEHCLVEIVDEDGQPLRPGNTGRLVVTALRNPAMPLIRYDSGDLAEIVDGPCPCGRTLPSFGAIQGRARRIACLPAGSWNLWVAVQESLAFMPPELCAALRQYQLHQSLDNTWELRLAVIAPLAPEFHERVTRAWAAATSDGPVVLRIAEVPQISRETGRKFENFVSDYIERAEGRLVATRDS
jgi:phenylacetate-CoA ligase